MLSALWMANAVIAAGAIEPYQDETSVRSFTLNDLDNASHSLENYRGRVVLVNFWASWCTPCIREMPGMQRLSDMMDGRPFDVVAINVSEGKKAAQRIQRYQKIRFTILLDPDGKAFGDWQANMLPTSYLVDSAGRIRYKALGPLEWDEDEQVSIIESLMPDQP